MKVAIIHDYFDKMGGGERLVIEMAKILDADIYTGYVNWDKTYKELRMLNVFELGARKRGILRIPSLIIKFISLDLSNYYDMVIFSGTYSIYSSLKNRRNMWYCHTPSRYLYSQKNFFLNKVMGVFSFVADPLVFILRRLDMFAVSRIKFVIANSKNVRNRILRFYGNKLNEKLTIIHPFVDTKKYVWKGQLDYYLSYGRIDATKRIDLIVQAFQRMPDKKLIIASGGPLIEKIKKLSKGFDNIKVVGWVNDDNLSSLLGKCIATIYIPVDEDFGMTPIESMAAGKPCIGVDEGGLKETIIHKKTGYLCPSNPSIDDIVEAVEWMTPKRAKRMKKACISHAELFSLSIFKSKIKNIVKENISSFGDSK